MITARTQQQMTKDEESAVRKFFSEHPELGDGASEQQIKNANAFQKYLEQWNVVVNEESLQAAYEKLRAVAGVLQITSEARLKYAEAAKTSGYDQSHQDVLDAFMRRVHLVSDPADDRTFENCTHLFNAMKGREFNESNLMWCLDYIRGRSGRGVTLHWEQRPSQNVKYGQHSGGDRHFMPRNEVNRPSLPSHSSNPRLNGQAERERDRQHFNQPPDDVMASHNWVWKQTVEKAVAEGRTHTERARIAQVAQQTPGGPRLQAEAAQKEAALIRQERERAR